MGGFWKRTCSCYAFHHIVFIFALYALWLDVVIQPLWCFIHYEECCCNRVEFSAEVTYFSFKKNLFKNVLTFSFDIIEFEVIISLAILTTDKCWPTGIATPSTDFRMTAQGLEFYTLCIKFDKCFPTIVLCSFCYGSKLFSSTDLLYFTHLARNVVFS